MGIEIRRNYLSQGKLEERVKSEAVRNLDREGLRAGVGQARVYTND